MLGLGILLNKGFLGDFNWKSKDMAVEENIT